MNTEDMIIFNIGWDTKLITSPEFILREIGDESILVPVVTEGPLENTMMTMNESAAYLWRQFSKGKTPNEVFEIAIHEFEDGTENHEVIRASVYRYVLESVDLKILVPADPDSGR